VSNEKRKGGAYDVPLSPSGTSGSPAGEAWPEFEPLHDELPPVEPFDFMLLPEALRPWITDIAERMQCPPDFPAAASLVAAGSLVGRKVGIYPKCQDDWLVVANLWGGAVGRPSLLKTPSVREVMKPLQRLEVEAKQNFESELATRRAEHRVEEAKEKALDKKIRVAIDAENESEATRLAEESIRAPRSGPTRKRYLVNDATVEKLGELLNENVNGLLIFRDELMGFLRSLEKEGHECDRAFYLEAWTGNSRYTYDRIGRGTIDIEAATVSIFGCVQPGPLASYMRRAINDTEDADGFVQRFQVIVWPDPGTTWRNVDRHPNTVAKTRAYEVFKALDQLAFTQLEVETVKFAKDDDIPGLRFDPAAQAVFDAWREKFEARLSGGEEHGAFESHLAKYRSLVPSITLILHLIDGGRGPVGVVDLNRALGWARYLESHARRIYSVGQNGDVVAAKAIEKRIRRGDLREEFTLRQVYRPKWSGLTQKEDAEKGIALLVELGWLRSERRLTKGAPTTCFRIHPDLRASQPPPGATASSDESPTARDEDVH